MSNMEDHINKMREERVAREKARILKLREINLKKYSKIESQNTNISKIKPRVSSGIVRNASKANIAKEKEPVASTGHTTKIDKKLNDKTSLKNLSKITYNKQENKTQNETVPKIVAFEKPQTKIASKCSALPLQCVKSEPALAVKSKLPRFSAAAKRVSVSARKSMLPNTTNNIKSQSVFERLYKPKIVAAKPMDPVNKLKTDSRYLKQIIKQSNAILHKCEPYFDPNKPVKYVLPHKSISAVDFKRVSKNELENGIHRNSSIDKLDKCDLDLNEDEAVREDKFVSAIKSDRKKLKFMTHVQSNFNTPKSDELQSRLKSWLQKRGKSFDSYHHLQCFGIHHMKSGLEPLKDLPHHNNDIHDDEENKENIALDSDSDNGSYFDMLNVPEKTVSQDDKIDCGWRRVSVDSESIEFHDSNHFHNSTITSDTLTNVDDLLHGALNDLTTLLREGFDWEQSARWLRSIRERFPHALDTAAYWECRAALENSRGDMPASMQCWEKAIAKGAEHSVVESNLEKLLDKFMELKINPKRETPKYQDPKMLVFKSTIIRFAVQQAKLRNQTVESSQQFMVTPVRRSGRLSCRPSCTPLQVNDSVRHAATICDRVRLAPTICDSLRQAATIAPQHVFTPNTNFVHTP